MALVVCLHNLIDQVSAVQRSEMTPSLLVGIRDQYKVIKVVNLFQNMTLALPLAVSRVTELTENA